MQNIEFYTILGKHYFHPILRVLVLILYLYFLPSIIPFYNCTYWILSRVTFNSINQSLLHISLIVRYFNHLLCCDSFTKISFWNIIDLKVHSSFILEYKKNSFEFYIRKNNNLNVVPSHGKLSFKIKIAQDFCILYKNFQNEITFYFRYPFISSRTPRLRDPWKLDSNHVRETKRVSRKRRKERRRRRRRWRRKEYRDSWDRERERESHGTIDCRVPWGKSILQGHPVLLLRRSILFLLTSSSPLSTSIRVLNSRRKRDASLLTKCVIFFSFHKSIIDLLFFPLKLIIFNRSSTSKN